MLLAKHNLVPEELVAWLLQGNVDSIGVGTLKLLLSLLPSNDEVQIAT